MAKYAVWLTAHREVSVEVVVEAESEDKAAEAAIVLFESDRLDSLEWENDGRVLDADVVSVDDCDESEPVTEVRRRW